MSEFTVYVDDEAQVEVDAILLSERESHHLSRVLRARSDDVLTLFDGEGSVWKGYLATEGKRCRIQIERFEKRERRECPLLLAPSLLKTKAMDLLIRQSTEFGVDAIYPILAERSEVKLSRDEQIKKLARWKGIAIEACKQCGNIFLPKLHSLQMLSEWELDVLPCVASLEEDALCIKALSEKLNKDAVCLFIGPEGDFTEREYAKLREMGAVAFQLNENVLRADTASLVGLSILKCLRDR